MFSNMFKYWLWLLFSLSTQPLVTSDITPTSVIQFPYTGNTLSLLHSKLYAHLYLGYALFRLSSELVDTDYRNTWTWKSRLAQHLSWSHCPKPLKNPISGWVVQCTHSYISTGSFWDPPASSYGKFSTINPSNSHNFRQPTMLWKTIHWKPRVTSQMQPPKPHQQWNKPSSQKCHLGAAWLKATKQTNVTSHNTYLALADKLWLVPSHGTYHCHFYMTSKILGIMHHFSMELLSTSNPVLISIYKHWLLLVHGFLSFILQSSLISLHRTAIDQHVQSNDLKSVLKDPSDIEMEDLSKPNHTLKLKQSLQSLKSTQLAIWHKQCPIMALLVVPQLILMAPTVVSEPSLNDITIIPLIPTNPLFPPCLWPQRPYHFGEDIT